jgi:hypothetical protein
MSSESVCQAARSWWTWQFSHAFSREVYDLYIVSPEYFGYTLVPTRTITQYINGLLRNVN